MSEKQGWETVSKSVQCRLQRLMWREVALDMVLRPTIKSTYGTTDYAFTSTDAVAFQYTHFGASSGTRTVYLDEVQ